MNKDILNYDLNHYNYQIIETFAFLFIISMEIGRILSFMKHFFNFNILTFSCFSSSMGVMAESLVVIYNR